MAEKYVRCNSHCKYPAYDKEEIDNLFYKKTEVDSKVTEINEKYAVVDVTTTVRDSSSGNYSAPIMKTLPEGFTPTNCVVISKTFGGDTGYTTETKEDIIYFSVMTVEGSNYINGMLSTTDSTKVGQTYKVRIVLMKI